MLKPSSHDSCAALMHVAQMQQTIVSLTSGNGTSIFNVAAPLGKPHASHVIGLHHRHMHAVQCLSGWLWHTSQSHVDLGGATITPYLRRNRIAHEAVFQVVLYRDDASARVAQNL